MKNDKILTQDTKQADSTQIIDLNSYTKPKYCQHHKLFFRGKECILCKEEAREKIYFENFMEKEAIERSEMARKNSMKQRKI